MTFAKTSTSSAELRIAHGQFHSPSWLAQPPQKVALAILLLVVVLFGLIRYRLRDMPLERDEGEYAYSGQLLLEGIAPYKLSYNMKLPGIYAAYAAVMAAFGETPGGIHIGLLLVNAATVMILYFLTSLLFGRLAGIVSGSTYALLSTSTSVLGFEAHATNFVVLPAVTGILLAVMAADSRRRSLILLSGACSGIAVLMKQHGFFLALFCLLYLCWRSWKRDQSLLAMIRGGAIFAAGASLPYAVTCFLLYRAGVFSTFWFWTVSYAGEYSKIGLRRAIHAFLENSSRVVNPAVIVWLVAALGLSALWWGRDGSRHRFFMVTLFLVSFASICPGAYFRPHYFVLLLPAVAMLAGVGVSSVTKELVQSPKRRFAIIPVVMFVLALEHAIVRQRMTYFVLPPDEVLQATYPDAAFGAAKEVADYVRQHTQPNARIAVVGSEPEIYFYAHRRSATGYIYMYGLIGHHKYLSRMQEQMLRELQQNQPEYLVYVDTWDSWGDRSRATEAQAFLKSLDDFMNSQYEKVGVADVGQSTRYLWGDAAHTYVPDSSKTIYVLKRRIIGTAGVLS
jgi:4-amino-4-deoxy-L-arabinose transferase-like glycosyltransferase